MNFGLHFCVSGSRIEAIAGTCSVRADDVDCSSPYASGQVLERMTRVVNISELPIWSASTMNSAKAGVLGELSRQALEYARAEGQVHRAIANDLNLADPSVFVVVDVRLPEGREDTLLIYYELNTSSDPCCRQFRVERGRSLNRSLVDRIRSRGVPLRH